MVQIDFFTLGAQVVNFLVLVILMRHFLYTPIINAMDEREKRIASRLEEALQKKKEALAEAESYRKIKLEFSHKREEMLANAREMAQTLHKELAEKAHREVEEDKAKWYESVERQKDEFLKDLRRRAGEQIFSIARRALRDLANDELERHIISTFIKRLQNMEECEKEAIKEFYQKTHQKIVITSAFEIPEDMRQHIKDAVQNQTGGDVELQFKIAPELISGIELSTEDMQITWNLASYLDALEEGLSEALERKAA